VFYFRPQPNDFAGLDWETLAKLIESDDPETRRMARDAIAYRAWDLCVTGAAAACRRLFHRSGSCRRYECDGAFISALREAIDYLAGHDAGTHGKARVALLEVWGRRRSGSEPFEVYAKRWFRKGQFFETVLRTWNVDRGLRARPRVSKAMEVEIAGVYAMVMDNVPELREAAVTLGIESPKSAKKLALALAHDAAQTGLEREIDVARVARHLDLDECVLRSGGSAFASLLYRFDSVLAAGWPDWYDSYVASPRDLTRTTRVGERSFDMIAPSMVNPDDPDGGVAVAA